MPIDSDRYRFATRLNSFRDRGADGGATASDLLRAVARVPGLTAVELNYPQHLQVHGTTETELIEALAETGLALTALSLRFEGPDDLAPRAGRDVLVKSIKAIADHDAKAQLEVVEQLISEGHDLRNFCRDLMSVIRDLMVYKVAGSSDILLEGAMLEPAQVTELAAHFSESDLLRFFNSVAETETNLKEATQPRYMLELGLVRLVEMRRLTPIG